VVVTLEVEGMTCDGCENAIKAGVESLEGIAEVESSHEEAWTRVKYDKNATSVEDISAKITDTGYEVRGEAAEEV
jgi:copper chaperone